MKIPNKTFIITGAGSGMGQELTVQLIQKGAKVAMVDIHEKGLDETEALVGKEHVSKHVLNIADKTQVEKLPEQFFQYHKTIDGLINNAGIIQPFIPVNALDYEQIERVMDVNFNGTVYMTKTFLPYLLKSDEAHIANVSSMGGFIPFPGQTVYSASKAAVKIFTEGLYSELKSTNIGVTVIHPGAINTNIMSNSGVEMRDNADAANKTLPANKAAAIMIRAIEKNKYRVMVGKDARMLDIIYRISPKMAVNLITKQMAKMVEK